MRNFLLVIMAVLIPSVGIAGGIADRVSSANGGAQLDSAVSALTGAQVVAAKGSSNVSVKASLVSSFTESVESDGTGTASFSVWSLTASAPLNKNGDSDVASLDGMVNAASLELKYSQFLVPGKRNKLAARRSITKLDAICKRMYEEKEKQTDKKDGDETGCDSNLVDEYGTEQDKYDYASEFWDLEKESNRWIYGANAKLGYQNYEFIDVSSVKKQKQDETPWTVGTFLAYNPDALRTIFILNVQYQDTFKESTSGTVCPARDGSGSPLSCLTGPIGKAKATKKNLVSLETRRDLGFAGVGLTATYDLEGRVWGVELPVYFVKDKEGKFNAGIKLGWRDDTHDVTASVFVGTAFGLFE